VVATQGRGTFEIDTDIHGPRVMNLNIQTPVLPSVSSIIVSFDKPVDPRTFTTDDVRSILGPNGPITPLDVLDLDPVNHQNYTIEFVPQSGDGIYSVTLGPNIADFVGNLMDQNNNGLNGEDPGDRYFVRFTINTTDDGRFVSGAYHDVLNRTSDTEGFLSFL